MSECPSCALIRRVVIGPLEPTDRDRRVLFAGWWDAFHTAQRAIEAYGTIEFKRMRAESCDRCRLAQSYAMDLE